MVFGFFTLTLKRLGDSLKLFILNIIRNFREQRLNEQRHIQEAL